MKKIKLYIISHKDIKIPSSECLTPIRADRTDGINISEKTNYCELRAQYWVWKNGLKDIDFIGFFHYRRYLDFYNRKHNLISSDNKVLPYRIKKLPQPEKYYYHNIAPQLQHLDAIAPIFEYTGITAYERYAQSQKLREKDLQLIRKLIDQFYPQYSESADTYLNGVGEYYMNMYILRRPLFQDYAMWLFDILQKFDQRVPNQLPKTNGYLGERLFGIWYTWLKKQKKFRCKELPRVHFYGYDDLNHHFRQDRIANAIIPPGSKRRAFIRKKILKIKKKYNE